MCINRLLALQSAYFSGSNIPSLPSLKTTPIQSKLSNATNA